MPYVLIFRDTSGELKVNSQVFATESEARAIANRDHLQNFEVMTVEQYYQLLAEIQERQRRAQQQRPQPRQQQVNYVLDQGQEQEPQQQPQRPPRQVGYKGLFRPGYAPNVVVHPQFVGRKKTSR